MAGPTSPWVHVALLMYRGRLQHNLLQWLIDEGQEKGTLFDNIIEEALLVNFGAIHTFSGIPTYAPPPLVEDHLHIGTARARGAALRRSRMRCTTWPRSPCISGCCTQRSRASSWRTSHRKRPLGGCASWTASSKSPCASPTAPSVCSIPLCALQRMCPLTDGRTDGPWGFLAHIFSLGWSAKCNDKSDGYDFEDTDSNNDMHSTISSGHSSPLCTEREQAEEKERSLLFNFLSLHVCTLWRVIAIDHPLLWSHIQFVDPLLFDCAKMYLERAKAASLSISIDCSIDNDKGNFPVSDNLYEPEDSNVDLVIIKRIVALIVTHLSH
ncbi:hypothetical protein BC628DRAFT_363856 [Trametes gibbosa]|nr:hypothetical protein BC628DRAFT_363856 [Trametes gibbosa]